MPLIFISLNDAFTEKIRLHGLEAYTMRIQDFVPRPQTKTFYVSPANSLCFMDGGMDHALSKIVFPGIEPRVKDAVRKLGMTTKFGRPYLPIGSSMIVQGRGDENTHRFLVVAPTMLLPQDVSQTRNAYFATMAVLYNVLVMHEESLDRVDILLTSFCGGYGKMDVETSVQQILDGIRDFHSYTPTKVPDNRAVVLEPNLLDQPKYYQNTEWFDIEPGTIKTV